MPKTEITGLPAIGSVDGDELLPCRDALGDVKITLDQIATHTKDAITPAETLAHVIAANPETSGLNANMLQGLLASYFTNASNLSSGTVPDARLPGVNTSPSWVSGGAYPNAGSFKDRIKLPEFMLGGARYMIQFGWTNFITPGNIITTSFREPFAAGWGTENKPLLLVVPECRGSEWSGGTPAPGGAGDDVEMDIRLWYSDLSSFKVSNIRTDGSLTDHVRANWLAVGKY